jgi:hypothetical protein
MVFNHHVEMLVINLFASLKSFAAKGSELPESDNFYAGFFPLPQDDKRVVFEVALVWMLPDEGG